MHRGNILLRHFIAYTTHFEHGMQFYFFHASLSTPKKSFCDGTVIMSPLNGTGKMSLPMSEWWNEERYFLEHPGSEKSDGYGQGDKGGNDRGGGSGPAQNEHEDEKTK